VLRRVRTRLVAAVPHAGDVLRFLVLLAVLFLAFLHAMLPLADLDPRYNDRVAFLPLLRLLTKLLMQPDLEPESPLDVYWLLPTVGFAVLCSILAVNLLIAMLAGACAWQRAHTLRLAFAAVKSSCERVRAA